MNEIGTIGLQYLVKFRSGQDYKHVQDDAGEVPVIGSGGPFTTATEHLYDGESVLFGRKGTIDRPMHIIGKFWTVDTMFYTELSNHVDGRWLYYWSTTIPFGLYSTDTALPSMTSSTLGRLEVPVLSLETQRRIADYLDRETSKIDAIIGKLDAVVQELTQRRARLIQQQTINSPSPMSRMKFCAEVSLGKTFQGVQKNPEEKFVNYVRAASIQSHGLELDDQRMWMTDTELAKYDLRAGDVLIVEGGAGYGRSVALTEPMPQWGFQNHVIRVRPNRDQEGRFLNYCVKAHLSAGLVDVLVDGATIPALSSDKARELPVPKVSLEEQRRIADYLDEVTSKIDTMLAKVAELKALLTERRAALITAVVTGRKDVA